jgi:hypothetical protein
VERTIIYCVMPIMSACNMSLLDLLVFPFDGFWGLCGDNSCNVFLLLFMVL